MHTELYCPALASLGLPKALGAIVQAHAQLRKNKDASPSPLLDNQPSLSSMEACLVAAGFTVIEGKLNAPANPSIEALDRVKVIRAIHEAYLQLAANSRHLDNAPDNNPVLCVLAGCLVEAGHQGFPLPSAVKAGKIETGVLRFSAREPATGSRSS